MSQTNLADPDVVAESDQEVIDVPDDSASQYVGNVCRTPKPVREIQAILQREEDLQNMQCVRRKVSGLRRMANGRMRTGEWWRKGQTLTIFFESGREWQRMQPFTCINAESV